MSNGNGINRALPYISLVSVIGVAVGAGIAWGGQNKTVESHGASLEKQEQRIERVEDAIQEQSGRIRVLDERSQNTREDVKEIKQGVRDVLDHLRSTQSGSRR